MFEEIERYEMGIIIIPDMYYGGSQPRPNVTDDDITTCKTGKIFSNKKYFKVFPKKYSDAHFQINYWKIISWITFTKFYYR